MASYLKSLVLLNKIYKQFFLQLENNSFGSRYSELLSPVLGHHFGLSQRKIFEAHNLFSIFMTFKIKCRRIGVRFSFSNNLHQLIFWGGEKTTNY